jgi:membrane fusion protein (multidrug efflux system)
MMNTSNEMSAEKQNGSGKPPFILIIVLVIATIGTIVYYIQTRHYVTTDNAQIDGNIIPLRTKIGGYVESVRFHDNQRVNKGDTLAIFETTDLRAQVIQAQARFDNATAGIEISKNGKTSASFVTTAADFNALAAHENIAAAKARLEQAQADFNRTGILFEQKAATAQAYDATRSAFTMAQAQYESARKQYQALTAQKQNATSQVTMQDLQLQASQSRFAEAKAQLDLALYLLSNAYIIAPCSGIISKKNVEPGQLLPPGSALAMLIDDKNIWITANFKETQLNKVKEGQDVTIDLDAYRNVKIEGIIESCAGASGAKFALLPPDNSSGNFVKVTQRIPVRISLKNIFNPDKRALLPGMSVVAKVKVQ